MKDSANRVLSALAIAFTLAGPLPASYAASAPAELSSAIADYNAKKYSSAIAKLQKVSAANRDNPHTHYYLALSYQAIGNWSGAKREYKWNYDNSKDPDIRYRSWAAYTALEKSKRSPGSSNGNLGVGAVAASQGSSNWGSAANLDKPAEVLNGADYETVTVTGKSCGRR